MNQITLIRGLPGSGKTTKARSIQGEPYLIAADDYFYTDGEYVFDPSKLKDAHGWCQFKATSLIASSRSHIVVHNTFTMKWEAQFYVEAARRYGYKIDIINCYDGGCTDEELAKRNTHGVPVEAIKRMRYRWENMPDEVMCPF